MQSYICVRHRTLWRRPAICCGQNELKVEPILAIRLVQYDVARHPPGARLFVMVGWDVNADDAAGLLLLGRHKGSAVRVYPVRHAVS